jgi:hypothetical protein
VSVSEQKYRVHSRSCLLLAKNGSLPETRYPLPLPALDLTWVKRSAETMALGGMKARKLKFFGPRTTALTKE